MKKSFNILSAISIFLCMLIIYMLSAQKSSETTSLSLRATRKILSIVFENFEHQSNTIKNYMISDMHYTIRKIAHFMLYYGLSAVVYIVSYLNKIKYKKCFLFSMTVSVIYAISDEFHQFFVDGRTAKITDVLIDSSGAFCGAVTIFAIISCISYIKTHNNQ